MTLDVLNSLAESCLQALWRATWQGAVAAAVVLIVCLTFRRLPFSVRNLLWWLVCARMLVALSPASLGVPVPAEPPRETMAAFYTPLPPVPAASLPAPRYEPPFVPTNQPRLEPIRPSWQLDACGIWLIGATVFALFSLFAVARAYRMAGRAIGADGPLLLDSLDSAARQVGLRRSPRALISDESRDVLTLGFFRPAVLLPKNVLERSPEELSVILAHECIHIRRFDAQMGLVPQFAQIVFFFNPLVWLVTREFNLAREAACDQAAMAAAQIGPDRYGRLLLVLGARQDRGRTLCLPGASSHFHILRRRIAMLDRISRQPLFRPKRGVVAALSLTSLLCILPIGLVQGRSTDTASKLNKPSVNVAKLGTAHKHAERAAHKKTQVTVVARRKVTVAKPQVSAMRIDMLGQTRRSDGASTTVFSLQFAKAAETAAMLNHLYAGQGPQIESDGRTNSVVVRGSKDQISEVTRLLTNLDQPGPTSGVKPDVYSTHMFHLHYATAESLAKVLQSTVATRGAVSIGVDARTNSLVVVSDPDREHAIENVVRELDVPTSPVVTRRVRVLHARAAELEQIVLGHLGHPKDLVEITVEQDDNTFVITASEDTINRFQTLVSVFDNT